MFPSDTNKTAYFVWNGFIIWLIIHILPSQTFVNPLYALIFTHSWACLCSLWQYLQPILGSDSSTWVFTILPTQLYLLPHNIENVVWKYKDTEFSFTVQTRFCWYWQFAYCSFVKNRDWFFGGLQCLVSYCTKALQWPSSLLLMPSLLVPVHFMLATSGRK